MNEKRLSLVLATALLLYVLVSALAPFSAAAQDNAQNTVAVQSIAEGTLKNFSMNVGADETERNFTWYYPSESSTVEYAIREGDTFPDDFFTAETISTPNKDTYIHRATILGLQPDTEYVYRIRSGSYASENYYFETDPIDSFNFIFVGDPQIGASGVANDTANWKKTVSAAYDMFPNTSFLVSAGDQVEESYDSSMYDGFIAPEEFSSLAIATTIGNHDYDTALYSAYFNNPNRTIDGKTYGSSAAGENYWYTYNNTLFMHLNTCNVSFAEHKAFMEEAIAANPNVTWKIVVTHYTFFGAGPYYSNEIIAQRREQFAPIVDELDIDVVLSGHEHVYARAYMINDGFTPDSKNGDASSVTDPEGILYITGGSSSGSKFYTLLDDASIPHIAVKEKNTIAFSNVEIDKDSFKITTYRVKDGSVLDSFEIIKDKNLVTDPKNNNLAEGNSYETSGTCSDGNTDENGTALTDGILADGDSSVDTAYVGFDSTSNEYTENGCASVTVELGSVYELDRFVAFAAASDGGDVKAPKSMTVSTSVDGIDFQAVGSVTVNDVPGKKRIRISIALDEAVSAEYVRFDFTAGGKLIMISEVEAYEKHTHIESDWITQQEPTYHCNGIRLKRCSACGETTEYEFIPVLERSPDNKNVALGKNYKTNELYKKNGLDRYPDENGTTMTDGLYAEDDALYNSPAYIGLHTSDSFYAENGYFYITVDLEEAYHLNKFTAYTASEAATAGVVGPKTVSFYVSEDNESWILAGAVSPEDTTEASMVVAEIETESCFYGRYVQFRFVANSSFVMVAEVEAYEGEVEAHEHVSSDWYTVKTEKVGVEGKKIKYCTECGITVESEVIPALDPSIYGENIVAGMGYERSELYKKDGQDRYPDENGSSMTDGAVAPDNALYSHAAYMGFYAKYQDYIDDGYFHITFDLGAKYELWKFTTYVASAYNRDAGVDAPASVSVYVSDSGTDWNEAGTVVPEDSEIVSCIPVDIVLDEAVTARYVQFRYVHKNTFVMVAETELYGFESPVTDPEYKLGDVNNNGEIEKYDYILVKRAAMGTVVLDEAQKLAADVNKGGAVEKYDYILIKRHVMNTYLITE